MLQLTQVPKIQSVRVSVDKGFRQVVDACLYLRPLKIGSCSCLELVYFLPLVQPNSLCPTGMIAVSV